MKYSAPREISRNKKAPRQMNKIFQLLLDNAKREKQSSGLIKNESGASIYIYDVIDSYWGVSAKSVIEALASVGDDSDVAIRINSPGGDVFEGRAIMAAIKNHQGKTTCYIDSLAASAATSIALACDEVVIAKGAFFMIHNASSAVWGDKNAMRDTADLLEKIEGSIVDDYIGKTGAEHQQIVDWMNAETWFSSEEAIANGFCDRLAETAKAKNTWNLAAYANAPQALLEPDPPEQIEEQPEPAPAGFFMSAANANRLKLALI
jgi:ATP-dependent Clp protease protease subunit